MSQALRPSHSVHEGVSEVPHCEFMLRKMPGLLALGTDSGVVGLFSEWCDALKIIITNKSNFGAFV